MLLVEVLSPSTRDYDRGDKLENYQQLTSLAEVLFVDPQTRLLELVRRVGESWERSTTDTALTLVSVGAEVRVVDVFRDPLASAVGTD